MDYFLLDIVPDCILSTANQKVRINHHIIMDQEQGRKIGKATSQDSASQTIWG